MGHTLSLRRVMRAGLAAALLIFGSLSTSAGAQPLEAPSCTITGGLIGVDTILATAASPYCVTSSIDVASGVTLTIQPGIDGAGGGAVNN